MTFHGVARIGTAAKAPLSASGQVAGIVVLAVVTGALTSQLVYGQGGTVETTSLTASSLEGNFLGNSTTRRAQVYLPPSYESSNRRYPVVYYLHGAFGNQYEFFNYGGQQTANQLIQNGTMEEMIIVGVDGSSRFLFSSYVNSELNGNYEDYIVQDLVNHVDATCRTIADRNSRGVFGASMGGYGSLRYGMKHSVVFGAAYGHSSGLVSLSWPGSYLYLGEDQAVFSNAPNAGNILAGVECESDIQGELQGIVFGWASGLSPNLENPRFPCLNVDLPFELPGLEIIPEIRDKWMEHDIFALLDNHTANASSLKGLAFDVGNLDYGNLQENEVFHQTLLDADIPHQFEVFSGGHTDRLNERLAISLKFLSDTLIVRFGDFDGNGRLDANDIDLLSAEIFAGTNSPAIDLTGDGNVDEIDLITWLSDAAEHNGLSDAYLLGDSNLDGSVNAIDLNNLALSWRQNTSEWSRGDFTANGVVDSADLNALALNWRRAIPMASAASFPVPEPSALLVTLVGLASVCGRARRR